MCSLFWWLSFKACWLTVSVPMKLIFFFFLYSLSLAGLVINHDCTVTRYLISPSPFLSWVMKSDVFTFTSLGCKMHELVHLTRNLHLERMLCTWQMWPWIWPSVRLALWHFSICCHQSSVKRAFFVLLCFFAAYEPYSTCTWTVWRWFFRVVIRKQGSVL